MSLKVQRLGLGPPAATFPCSFVYTGPHSTAAARRQRPSDCLHYTSRGVYKTDPVSSTSSQQKCYLLQITRTPTSRLDYSHNRFGHITRFERKSSQVGRLDGTDGCGILPSCATSIHGGKTDTAALMADSIGQKEAFAASSAQDAVIPKPKSVQCCRWGMRPRNPISKTASFPPGQRMSSADLVFSAQEAKMFPTRPRTGPRRRALHLRGKP